MPSSLPNIAFHAFASGRSSQVQFPLLSCLFDAASIPADFIVLSYDLINTFLPFFLLLLHSNLLYFFAFPSSVSTLTADSLCLELPISATALRCILTHFIYTTPTDPNHDLVIILPFNRTPLRSQVQAPLLSPPLPPPKEMTPFRDTRQMR
jgi:hypothetical protein